MLLPIHLTPGSNVSPQSKVELLLESIKSGIINSAHDISDGGLAVAIAESLIYSADNLGVKLDLTRKNRNDELLFGECQSSIIVSINEENLIDLINIFLPELLKNFIYEIKYKNKLKN